MCGELRGGCSEQDFGGSGGQGNFERQTKEKNFFMQFSKVLRKREAGEREITSKIRTKQRPKHKKSTVTYKSYLMISRHDGVNKNDLLSTKYKNVSIQNISTLRS